MKSSVRHIVLPLVAAFIWGSAFIFQGQVADKIGFFTFNASRSLIAFVFLIILSFSIDKIKIKKNLVTYKTDYKKLLFGGACCGFALFVAANLQQYGIIGATSAGGNVLTEGDSAFITALYIILTPVSGIFFKKKTTLNVWIASVLAVFGLFLLCGVSVRSLTIYHAALFACAVAFTVHILVIDHFTQTLDGVKLSCVQFFFAGIFSLIGALFTEKTDFSVLIDCAFPILYVGIFSSGIAYTLQIVAQKGTNPTVVSILLSLESVFALLCEFVFGLIRGQVKTHTPLEIIGCAIMLVAIVLAQIDIFSIIRNKKRGKRNNNLYNINSLIFSLF